MIRYPLTPTINGFDCAGILNPASFQAEPFFTSGDDAGNTLDGATFTDTLAAHSRLSWTMNSVAAEQYAALTDALNRGESPDTVTAYAFDPACNAVRLAKFHVTRPVFRFNFEINCKRMSVADGTLVLEESAPVAAFTVTPPNRTRYALGEPFDITGLSVMRRDSGGASVDITAECDITPADGETLTRAGTLTVSVKHGAVPLAFTELQVVAEIIDGGTWWTLYVNGLLLITADCPDDEDARPWSERKSDITAAALAPGVLQIRGFQLSGTKIRSISIPDSVSEIGPFAFNACAALESVTIPDSVTEISSRAFQGCSALKSVNVPAGITEIQQGVFIGCSALESVSIPVSVTKIGASAFEGCDALTEIYYGGTETQWAEIEIGDNNDALKNANIHYANA